MIESDLERLMEMGEESVLTGSTLAGVSVTSEVKVVKEEVSVKDKILSELRKYEEVSKKQKEVEAEIEALLEEALASSPNREKIEALRIEESGYSVKKESAAKELLPMFQIAVIEDVDNKTILYNKIQATYVYPTKKCSFDLKDFREKESDFYIDNIKKFTPYTKESDVSDFVKITEKK